MLICFEKPQCQIHHQPYEYFCMGNECSCELRLCLRCAHDHSRKFTKSDYMKQNNFYKKIEMETQIITKQYNFIEKYLSNEGKEGLLSSKNQESVKIVEYFLRGMNEDKRIVMKALDQFNFNHSGVKKKLLRIKSDFNPFKSSPMTNVELNEIRIALSSNYGLEKMRKNIGECQMIFKKYQDFMMATHKYGQKPQPFLAGLGFGNLLIRDSLRQILYPEGIMDKVLNEEEVKKIKLDNEPKVEKIKQKQKVCEQVCGPAIPSPKKIRLVTPKKRPRTSSSADKQY